MLPSGEVDPWEVFQKNPRAPIAASRHGNEAVPQRFSELRCRYYPRPRTTLVLGHGRETTPHHISSQLRLTRSDDWRHPLFSDPPLIKERTRSTRRARVVSRSSSPQSTIRWITRTRSGSTRDWLVFTTSFLGTQKSLSDKMSTATSKSGPRFSET